MKEYCHLRSFDEKDTEAFISISENVDLVSKYFQIPDTVSKIKEASSKGVTIVIFSTGYLSLEISKMLKFRR